MRPPERRPSTTRSEPRRPSRPAVPPLIPRRGRTANAIRSGRDPGFAFPGVLSCGTLTVHMFRLDFRVAKQYLSAKPVAGQVLDRESPSEKTEDRRAPPADTPAEPVSVLPSRPGLFWVSRPGEEGTEVEKEAFFASSAYRESWRVNPVATSPRGEP